MFVYRKNIEETETDGEGNSFVDSDAFAVEMENLVRQMELA